MAEIEKNAQNGSSDSPTPPRLSITVPKLRDIDPQIEQWERVKLPTDVLLLTVKDEEFLSCYAYLGNITRSSHKGLGRVYFGEMGHEGREKVKVSLMRCNEGAADVGGAQNVVRNAVSLLRPKTVIGVGFCGGLNRTKTKLGDVVISVKLSTYFHGVTANVSKNMGDLIRYAADGWKAPLENPEALEVVVHRDKEMLSGPELVDCDVRWEELLEKYPNAIAIEMEGEGVYAAAFDLEIEWAIIKGISGYADGTNSKTENWKPVASVMAASVVHNMLKEPGILEGWRHYGASEHTIPAPRELSTGAEPRRDENSVNDLLQSLLGGSSGQINYKGRTIAYTTSGRFHSLKKPWVFDGKAWDIESGLRESKNGFEKSGDAIQFVVNKLIQKLEEERKI